MLPVIRDIHLGAAQRGGRALAFLGIAGNRRAVIVLQEGQRNVVGDFGHRSLLM